MNKVEAVLSLGAYSKEGKTSARAVARVAKACLVLELDARETVAVLYHLGICEAFGFPHDEHIKPTWAILPGY